MKIQCAWCGADLGEKEPLGDTSITHGMCSRCRETERQTGELEMAVKNDPERFGCVRNGRGHLVEVCDHREHTLYQKESSGWCSTRF